MTSHTLSNEQTKIILESFKTCGLISYGNNLSRALKENCYKQLVDMNKNSKGIKMMPIVITDSNLRSHREKYKDGWRKVDNDSKIKPQITYANGDVYIGPCSTSTYGKLKPYGEGVLYY